MEPQIKETTPTTLPNPVTTPVSKITNLFEDMNPHVHDEDSYEKMKQKYS